MRTLSFVVFILLGIGAISYLGWDSGTTTHAEEGCPGYSVEEWQKQFEDTYNFEPMGITSKESAQKITSEYNLPIMEPEYGVIYPDPRVDSDIIILIIQDGCNYSGIGLPYLWYAVMLS